MRLRGLSFYIPSSFVVLFLFVAYLNSSYGIAFAQRLYSLNFIISPIHIVVSFFDPSNFWAIISSYAISYDFLRRCVFLYLATISETILLLLFIFCLCYSQGVSELSPSWPPLAVTVNGGATPTVGHLRQAVSAELGIQAVDKMVMFKYTPHTFTWFEIKPGMKAQGIKGAGGGKGGKGRGSAAVGGGAAGAKKGGENILQAPYSLKEGDLICACEWAAGDSGISVCRPMDLFLQAESERQRQEKRDAQSGEWGKKKSPRRPVVEVALSLGGNLDFSDDVAD